jgi:hypothetical protein
MAKTYEELLAGATQIKNNELPESNTHSLVGGQLVDMVEKQKEDSERIDNVSKSHKGYFQTLEQLKAKYPTPKEGETAWVGEPYPGNVYDVVDGAWHDTGVPANEGGGSGTSNYNDLENKPSIGNVSLEGNKTLDELGIASKQEVEKKQDAISQVNVTVDDAVGTPSGSATVSGSTLNIDLKNLKGKPGEPGKAGEDGPANTLTIGTVTLSESTEEARAEITGAAPHQTLNITLPRGMQGNSGVTGDTSDIVVVNDLNGGESEIGAIKVLAAEQGKVLNKKTVKKSNSVIQKLTYSDYCMSGDTGTVVPSDETHNGFKIRVEENSEYEFVGFESYGKVACFSIDPWYSDSTTYFLGTADVVNNCFKTLPNTNYIVTGALNPNEYPAEGNYYLIRKDEINNIYSDVYGAKEFISGLQRAYDDVTPINSGTTYVSNKRNIFVNTKSPYPKAIKIDTILYNSEVGTINFYLVTLSEQVAIKSRLLATVNNTTKGFQSIKIPYIELSENQYIGVNGTFRYAPSGVNGWGYQAFNKVGDTLGAIQEGGVIAIKPVNMSDIISQYVNRNKLFANVLECIISFGISHKKEITSKSTYISGITKNSFVAIKVNSVASDIVNIGLFTTSAWSAPVIWQEKKENLILNNWYFVDVSKVIDYDSSLYFNVYETIDSYSANIEVVIIKSNSQSGGGGSDNTKKTSTQLFKKTFNSELDSNFEGATQSNFTSDGLIVNSTQIKLNKYYSLTPRTVRYLCKFSSDTIAKFYSDTKDTTVTVNISAKKVNVANNEITPEGFDYSANNLNGEDLQLIEISKVFNKTVVNITNMVTAEETKIEIQTSGPGGVGDGVVSERTDFVGMQHDYYCFSKESGSDFIIKEMSIVSLYSEVELLIYGDSITEQESYCPKEDYENSWVQLLVKNVKGNVISSGRGGTTIDEVLNRIKNELPYIKAKYVMATIGTNSGNTEEKLSQLIDFIVSQGSIPILNNIPCNESGTQVSVNAMIKAVREKYNINGCRFDIATSIGMDGVEVDKTKMYWENYSSSSNVYHHPNVKGSMAMFAQLKIDVPEIF